MPKSPDDRAAPARHLTPIAVLALLAGRDRFLTLSLKPDGTRELHITKHDKSLGEAVRVPNAVFLTTRDNGWLVDHDGCGLTWRISPDGRAALRRARSAGGGPIPKPTARADAGTASSSSPAIGLSSNGFSAATNPAESPLSWLRRRRDKSGQPLISAVQFEAGERLRGDLWFAQMTPRVTVNWSATGGCSTANGSGQGVDIADNAAAAQQRVRRVFAGLNPISAGLLLDVCGHLLGLEQVERSRGWPPRSGKVALQMALSDLARHYGLAQTRTSSRPGASKLSHWATSDYRPTADHGPE